LFFVFQSASVFPFLDLHPFLCLLSSLSQATESKVKASVASSRQVLWRGAAALRSPLLVVAAAVGRSAAAASGRSVGTAENRLEKTKKKAAGAAAVFGLGEERNGSRPLFFLWREVSGRERPGCGLLLPLRERLSLAGVGDAAAEAGFGRPVQTEALVALLVVGCRR
jgi:hypothetical protein